MEHVLRRDARMREVHALNTVGQAAFQHVAEHGFAAADFAAHFDDPFSVGDRVGECFQYRSAIAAAEEEVGVRRDPEGGFREPEVLVVHGYARRWRSHAVSACPS
jgi:hypothetical protein